MQKKFACQITLPNGKYLYTGGSSILSFAAEELKLKCETVVFSGQCTYDSINEKAHDKLHIQINEVEVSTFLDKIATKKECREFQEEHIKFYK